MPPLNPITVAKAFVAESGDFALSERNKGNLQVEYKNDDINNVLTHVDKANSARARQMFKPFVDAGEILIDEEYLPTGTPTEIFASGQPIWVTDPVDGTRPFNDGQDSWGVMLARVEGDKVIFASIYMPSLKQRLEISAKGIEFSTDTFGKDQLAGVSRNIIAKAGSIVSINDRLTKTIALTEAHASPNHYFPSAAEMTIKLAIGGTSLIGLPSKAGFWDVAPAMALTQVRDYVAFFESDPQTLLTLGPDMFEANWQLKDHLVVTSRKLHDILYTGKVPEALQTNRKAS